MIDYDKLKLAHELSMECNTHYLVHIVGHKGDEYTLVDWKPERPDLVYDNIDDLISKLRKLTHPEPKYKVGDRLFRASTYYSNRIDDFLVTKITEDKNGFFYEGLTYIAGYEHELYPTKAALIEAQIQYWLALREPELNPSFKATDTWYKQAAKAEDEYCNVSGAKVGTTDCQHESDGSVYFKNTVGESILCTIAKDNGMCKCIKCGAFYR